MRTLVISDLHLGARRGADVLRRPEPLAALCARLREVDRLVLLGDLVELRHGPSRDALAAAEPVLRAMGEALGADAEVVLVPGNHDHALISPWLRGRGARRQPKALGLTERTGPRATPAIGRIARALAPATLVVDYPGTWIRDDVFATHGHYLDAVTTLPAFERLGAGVMARIEGPVPDEAALPDDFEARLAPMYAWLDAMAESRGGRWSEERAGASSAAWETLSAAGGQPLKARVLGGLFPLGIRGLNRAGLGPFKAQLSGEALRDAGLTALGDVLRRLQVDAEHVVFGHTHRAGPLPGDDPAPWRVRGGRPAGQLTQLHNCGCWLTDPVWTRGGPASPYWAGRGILVGPEGPPELIRVAEDLGDADDAG